MTKNAKKLRFAERPRWWLAGAGAIVGGFAGAAADNIIATSELRLALGACLCLSIVLASAVAYISSERHLVKGLEIKAQKNSEAFSAETTALRKDMNIRFANLDKNVGGLQSQLGFEGHFLKSEDFGIEPNPIHNLLKSATDEILVLDTYLKGGRYEQNLVPSMVQEGFDKYFELVERGGRYERIVQTEEGSSLDLTASGNELFSEHYRTILAKQDPYANLYIGAFSCTSKFSIIDQTTVILQIHRRIRGSQQFEVEGELILHDATGRLGSVFKEIWQKARKESRLVQPQDIPVWFGGQTED